MLSQQEISDRLEIQDLVFRYAQLVDALRVLFRMWSRLLGPRCSPGMRGRRRS